MQSIILTFIFTSVIIFLIIFVKIKYLEFQLYNTDMDKLEQKYLAIIDKNKSAISIGCAYLDLTTLYIKQGKYEKALAENLRKLNAHPRTTALRQLKQRFRKQKD